MASIVTVLPIPSATQAGKLFREEFQYSGSQIFTTSNNYNEIFSIEVTGVGTLSQSQYTLNPPNSFTVHDPLELNDFIVVLYGQVGSGSSISYTKVETDTLLNELEQDMTQYTDDSFIRGAKLYARTGIVDKNDQFKLDVFDINTVTINQVDSALFWEELFVLNPSINNAIKTFPQILYPLSELITATGLNTNVDPIISDGLYVRFLGYDKFGGVISSPNSFVETSSVVQLGFVTVVKTGSTIEFLGGITPGARNVFSQPILANLNDLDRITVNSVTDVTVNYNIGTPTLATNPGTITGISINWRSLTNPTNTSPVDKFNYLGDPVVDFASIDANFAEDITPPVNHTLWTDLAEGVAINESFYNTTSELRDTLNAGAFSIKRVLIGVRGGIFIQEGEHATAAGYATIEAAKANIYTQNFTPPIKPESLALEIARIIFQKGVTDFSDETKFFIVGTIGGTSSAGGIVTVGDATTLTKGVIKLAGDLSGTADVPTVPELANKMNIPSGTTNNLVKFLNPTTIGDSSIVEVAGSLGIGTINPSKKLEIVGGDALINGITAGRGNGDVSNNTAFGTFSLFNNTSSGGANTGFGYQTLAFNTIGDNNTAVGYNSMLNNVDGNFNVAVGYRTLVLNINGTHNTAVGYRTLQANTSGIVNTAYGAFSLQANTTGQFNVAIGGSALFSNTTGIKNNAFGQEALYNNITGTFNTAVGQESLRANTSGSNNTSVGVFSLLHTTIGSFNVALGENAGRYISDGATALTDANNSLFLGYNTKASAVGNTNEIVIGYNATGNGSNSITLGNTSVTKTILQGNVGIGTTTPSKKLDIVGDDALINGLTIGKGNNFIVSNTAIGVNALQNNTTSGTLNTAIGSGVLTNNTLGFSNTGIGASSLNSNTTGNNNTAVGYATFINLSGSSNDNTAIGAYAGRYIADGIAANTVSVQSIFIGAFAKANASSETNQIVIGFNAIGNGTNSVTLGNTAVTKTILQGNVGIGTTSPSFKLDIVGGDALINGTRVGRGNNSVSTNTVLGSASLSNASASSSSNTAIGFNASNALTTGVSNTVVGRSSFLLNTIGNQNTAIGASALGNSISGSANTAIGYAALFNLGNFDSNIALGDNAARFIADGTTTLTSATKSTFLGAATKASANGLINEIVIGFDAIGNGSDSVTLGSTLITKTILQGNVLIGTTINNGVDKLQINGTSISTAWKTQGGTSAQTVMGDGSLKSIGAITKTRKDITGTTYTILSSDADKILYTTNASPVVITVPSGLTINQEYEVLQYGDGQVSYTASGTTLRFLDYELASHYSKYARVSIVYIDTETYQLMGQLTTL